MACLPVTVTSQIASKAGDLCSGEDHAAGFLGKMQPDLGGDLSVRHFVSSFHVERAPAGFFGLQAFFEFTFRLARPHAAFAKPGIPFFVRRRGGMRLWSGSLRWLSER